MNNAECHDLFLDYKKSSSNSSYKDLSMCKVLLPLKVNDIQNGAVDRECFH